MERGGKRKKQFQEESGKKITQKQKEKEEMNLHHGGREKAVESDVRTGFQKGGGQKAS